MAGKSDGHLVLLCDSNCLYFISTNLQELWRSSVLNIYREIDVNFHYDAFCVHRQCVCFMLGAVVKDVCWSLSIH
jgi:hypothetical protein